MKKLKLPSGSTGFYNDKNEWVCTGSMMGRRNILPEFPAKPHKLRLVRLRWVDSDYDQGGAYWGNTGRDSVYWAEGEECRVFVRAVNRAEAKAKVRELVPGATFYN